MNEGPEDDESGPETDSDGKGKARVAGHPSRTGHAHGGAAHAIVPSTLRGPRARASRTKIKESLTDSTFEKAPVENHFNRR